MINVLFVCLGNICRSPMAEALFKNLVQKEGLDSQIAVDSAGTSGWHVGSPPHKGTLDILKNYHVNTEGLSGRQLMKEDAENFDYIIGMDASNIQNIQKLFGQSKHPHILRLLDLTSQPKDVPDPYYTGDFQETYDLLQEGCQRLLEKIKKEKL